MATMKVNKGKEIVGKEGRPGAQPQTRSLAGEKENPYQRILIWEVSPSNEIVDEKKGLSMGRPKGLNRSFLRPKLSSI